MKKVILLTAIFNLLLFFLVKAEEVTIFEGKNLILITEDKGEKVFYIKDSLKKLSDSKIEIQLVYFPREDISKRCEDYWISLLVSSQYGMFLWIPLEKEELERCRSLKYGVYRWQIDCKKKTYSEKDWHWYNREGIPVYTRKSTGISFLPIPHELIKENFFEKICK